MIYLYAIADGLPGVGDLQGVARESLRLLTLDSLTLVAGDVLESPPLDATVLADQDRVVRELHKQSAALLPMRFGTIYESVDAAARAIKTRGPVLRDALARVNGRDQMTLRILGRSTGVVRAASSGTEYLRHRAALATPPAIAPLIDALKPLQRATRIEASTTSGMIASVYQLIDRGSSETYVERVQAVAPRIADLTVRISGPSPCYAFG
jgi:hypothetical protein